MAKKPTNSVIRLARRKLLLGGAGLTIAPPVLGHSIGRIAPRAAIHNADDIRHMLGRLLIMGLPARSASDDSAKVLAEQLRTGKVAGSLLLRHNTRSREELTSLTDLFIHADTKVLNAVDQEGGLVQRLTAKFGFTSIPRAKWVADNLSPEKARELYALAAREMRGAGFNLNLAPSVDIHDPINPVIGKHGRSFSTNAGTITQFANQFISGMDSAGVACTLKHFPGHGSSRADSHDGFVDIEKTWKQEELRPFQDLANNAPLIMGGHLFHPIFSQGEKPITFSHRAIGLLLRHKLRYPGVIVTDDLDMGAIRSRFSMREAVIGALQAGNDLLLISNSYAYDPHLPDTIAHWIIEAIQSGELRMSTLSAAYHRVSALRERFALAKPIV